MIIPNQEEFNSKKSQAPLIADIMDKNNVHIFAEIGVWKFKTVKKLMIKPNVNRTIKEYWAIDPYAEMPQYADLRDDQVMHKMGKIPQERWDKMYHGVCKYLLWFHQVKLLRLTSEQAAYIFHKYRKPYFDMVFIDADHTYEAVKKDIELWKPLIRKGGILSGHDYGMYHEVNKAVDECVPDAIIFPKCWVWLTEV